MLDVFLAVNSGSSDLCNTFDVNSKISRVRGVDFSFILASCSRTPFWIVLLKFCVLLGVACCSLVVLKVGLGLILETTRK